MEKIFEIITQSCSNSDMLEKKLAGLLQPSPENQQWALLVQDNAQMPGNSIITGIEVGVFEPTTEVKIYPHGISCCVQKGPNHTFKCDVNLYLERGTVITNLDLRVGERIGGHFIPLTQSLPDELVVRIGTQTIPVESVCGQTLVLRRKGIYAPIDTFRGLGYGIITDIETREAVGIFVIGY